MWCSIWVSEKSVGEMWCVFLGEIVGEVVGDFCVFAHKSVHTKCGVVFLCR